MAEPHAIPELDRRGLRTFGFASGSLVAGLFGVVFPWLLERAFPLWPWFVLAVLGICAALAPGSLRPVYQGWMRFGLLLNKVTTPLVLGVIFILLFVPVGWVMRLRRYDPLRRRLDRNVSSYRVVSERPPRNNLENPF